MDSKNVVTEVNSINLSHLPDGNFRTFIIAEIGINHEGSFENCKNLVYEAAKAGANAIKLQTIDPELNYSAGTESYSLFKRAQLSRKETESIFKLARELNLEALTTVGDLNTLEWVKNLDPFCYKISSGLLSCTPLIKEIAKLNKLILISNGMSDDLPLEEAIKTVKFTGNKKIAILQCTSLYPTPPADLCLRQINRIKYKFGFPVGFSDHSSDPMVASYAVYAGAEIIETHLTFDSTRNSFDHKVSLDPINFKKMVSEVRKAEIISGKDTVLKRNNSIKKVEKSMSRYLATIRPIDAGEILNKTNVGFLRFPNGKGIMPANLFEDVFGQVAVKNLSAFSPLKKEDFYIEE